MFHGMSLLRFVKFVGVQCRTLVVIATKRKNFKRLLPRNHWHNLKGSWLYCSFSIEILKIIIISEKNMAARGGAYFSPNVYIANLNIFSLETARQIERNLAEILLW